MIRLLSVFSCLIVALVIIAAPLGFDVSDEGLYLMLAHPQQENQAGILNYDLFFKLFHELTSFHIGIVGLRIARLVAYFFAAFALSVFYRNIQCKKKLSFSVFLLAFLGLCSAYAFLPASLSYNHLSVVLVSAILAILSYSNQDWSKFFLMGIILGALVYVKISTALLMSIIVLLVGKSIHTKLATKFLLLTLPFLVFEILFYFFLGENASLRLLEGIEFQSARPDYHFLLLFKYTLVGVFWFLLTFGLAFVTLHLVRKVYLQSLLLIPMVGGIFYLTMITEEFNHLFLLIAAVAWAVLFKKHRFFALSSNQRKWLILLLILPFLLHFGSNVYWLRIGIHYLIFWIIAWYIWIDQHSPSWNPSFTWGVSCTSLFLVFYGLWWHPFQQKALWESTETWEYLPGKTILLSKSQVNQLHKMKELFHGQEQVFAAYRISGLPFLLGKTMPKTPGIWDESQLKAHFPNGFEGMYIYYPIDSLPDSWPAPTLILESFK